MTVDLPVLGYRERDLRSGFDLSVPHGNFADDAGPDHAVARLRRGTAATTSSRADLDRGLTWADLAAIRRWTGLPLSLKGILTAEDARLAVEHGVGRDRRLEPRRAPARSGGRHGRCARGDRRGGRRPDGGLGRRRRSGAGSTS